MGDIVNCPNCGFEQKDGSTECQKCRIIFAKWNVREKKVEENAYSAPPEESPLKKIDYKRPLFFLFIFVAIAYWYFEGEDKKAEELQRNKQKTHIASLEKLNNDLAYGKKTKRVSPKKQAKSLWIFQGSLTDLIRKEPVSDAKIFFSCRYMDGNELKNLNFEAETDLSGRYFIQLDPLPDNKGYQVEIFHSDYKNTWWDGSLINTARKEKFRLANSLQFRTTEETSRKGRKGRVTTHDFCVFPNKLTKKEQKEMSKAISQ